MESSGNRHIQFRRGPQIHRGNEARRHREFAEDRLLLDSRAAVLAGGDSGRAVVPGQPGKSLLVQAVRYEHSSLAMPPKGKLSAAVHEVPREVEDFVARHKLASMGISIDELTVSQKKYMSGWEQGT